MSDFLKQKKAANTAPVDKIKGDAAAQLIGESSAEDPRTVGFNQIEADRLGLKHGSHVQVAPDDNGDACPLHESINRICSYFFHVAAKSFLTHGKLVGLNREEVVLETRGSSAPVVHCHFPRLNFTIRSASASGSKL